MSLIVCDKNFQHKKTVAKKKKITPKTNMHEIY